MRSNNRVQIDRIIGSVLALALGDAFGAPYEGGILERALWAMLGTRKGKSCWTDDTRMSIDVIESLLACRGIDQDDLARRFARSYSWIRGYGPGAAKLLKRIRRGEDWRTANRIIYPDGSYGNGGAMRVAPIGLFYAAEEKEQLVRAAGAAAQITHAHPLGQEGAVLIALAAALARTALEPLHLIRQLHRHACSVEFKERLDIAAGWFRAETIPPAQTIAAELGNGIAAVESCVTAVYLGLAFGTGEFSNLLDSIQEVGGDVDTIGAMAGAVWGAARGYRALPETYLCRLEQREYLEQLGTTLAEAAIQRQIG